MRVSVMTQVVPDRLVPERLLLGQMRLTGWRRWALPAALAWALCYGSLRAVWAVTGAPSPPPVDSDLIGFTGWWAVGLCAAAAVVVVALERSGWSLALALAAWAVAIALAVASGVVLLDVVGLLLPGVGVKVSLAAFASRVACLSGAALVGTNVLSYQRHWHDACLVCGSTPGTVRLTRPPRWAWVAVWAAVAGCVVRLLAQLAVGFGSELLEGGAPALMFEVGFLLAGTVLPLALVCRWGRVFPGWLPILAGRRVARWWVLAPAASLGVGMTAYFGISIVKLAGQTLTGTWDQGFDGYPLWFFWLAVPAYLTWGLGLGVAAFAYHRITRPVCNVCGR
jgi:hypothetical protein